jgi:hypothetical protein
VKTLIDPKSLKKFAVTAVSFPGFFQKPAEFCLGGDHIMYCILYYDDFETVSNEIPPRISATSEP